MNTKNFVLETMYNGGGRHGSVDLFPRVTPTMTKKDFFDYNEDLVHEIADRSVNTENNNYERDIDASEDTIDSETEYLYEWMTGIASSIKKVTPSRIKTFPNEALAKTFMNVHYKNHGMLFFPVWSKGDNQFLLFYVGQR